MDNFIKSVYIDWNNVDNSSYLNDITALKNTEKIDFNKPITFFAGENGSGKSTLLEAIGINYGFNPEGGTKNYSFSTFDSHSELSENIILSKSVRKSKWGYFLRSESFYNVATKEIEYADYKHPSKKYHEKSHGEGFIALAKTQFKPNGLYLLDEPESALSPQRQLALLIEIKKSIELGSQFIIVTHSPIILGMGDSEILNFDNGKICKCNYEDTESYKITKIFLENRNSILDKLFKNE